jgi:hypothetical protein
VAQLRCYSAAANSFRGILQSQLEDIKAAGTFKTERVITSAQKSKIGVEGMGKKVLNFCANNYLGLSANEDIKNFAKDTLDKYGSGLSSVRFICGEFSLRSSNFQNSTKLFDLKEPKRSTNSWKRKSRSSTAARTRFSTPAASTQMLEFSKSF